MGEYKASILGVTLALFLSGLGFLGTRPLMVAEGVFTLGAVAVCFKAKDLRLIVPIGLLFLASIITTTIIYLSAASVDIYQIIRSSVWVLIGIIGLQCVETRTRKMSKEQLLPLVQGASAYYFTLGALAAIELLTKLPILPAVIRVVDDNSLLPRLYAVGIQSAIPFSFLFFMRGHPMAAVASLMLMVLTGGKAMIACALVCAAVGSFISKRHRFTILLIGCAFSIPLVAPYIGRIEEFIYDGDPQRARQIAEGLAAAMSNFGTIVFGIGHGTPFSEGYYQFGAPENNEALFENSRYDIENGYAYLFLRYGLLGATLLLYLLAKSIRHKSVRRLFFLASAILAASNSVLPGPAGALMLVSYGLVSGAALRLQSHNIEIG